ncbi:MAG: CotH kinase family protein [Prevotella sp.]|nr:CotH kinase family protein [Prevotella sp.]
MKRLLTIAILLSAIVCVSSYAQRRAHVYMNQQGGQWNIPVVTDSIVDITVSSDLKDLLFNVTGGMTVPFSIDYIDSLTFENEPAFESKDRYKVFQLFINTIDGSDVTSRDTYIDCHIALNAQGSFSNFSANAGIRGRGNSTFLWYDKKPYRFRLDQKHKMLGLDKARSWVLLANYRDVTDIMNTFVFEMGEWLGLPYTNHARYLELFLNGDYKGLYQLTEQIQQNKNRVNVSDERGILISLDVDDGPAEQPHATDNFWSDVYHMPVCVKYPSDEAFTDNTVDSVRLVLAELEQAIKSKDYEQAKQLLDIPSFIKYLQIQEFVYNVELSAPRSVFMHKDGDGPWVMGPLWDFDAGYDFDWGNMYTGHDFFADFRETVMGTNPLKRNGNYSYVPQFFTDLFACREFVMAYKEQWAAVKDSILTHAWDECMKYVDEMRLSGAIDREFKRWPIKGKSFETELQKMHNWLQNRLVHMSYLIAAIPEPDETPVTNDKVCGTVTVNVTMDWSKGYNQSNKVKVSKQKVLQLMGISESDLQEPNITIVPLNTDGSEGENHTNGVFGGWFNGEDNPGYYPDGHVYIEVFQDLWNWNCGLYKENCWDDAHTVAMQYQYPHDGTLLKVNVKVNFTINNSWW